MIARLACDSRPPHALKCLSVFVRNKKGKQTGPSNEEMTAAAAEATTGALSCDDASEREKTVEAT